MACKAWDPAPLRIVLGMNENLIPSRPILEPLVPDSIRERLGLDSQARRAARDAWLVEVLESSRSHSAKVEYIVPRQMLMAIGFCQVDWCCQKSSRA